jgi:uncharacterized membrane protein
MGWRRDLVLFLDRQIHRLSTRWLAVFNLLVGLYLLPPLLAPVLMEAGLSQGGMLIYALYRPACHQLPDRSVFLFGPRATYSADELWALGLIADPDALSRQNFVGAAQVGFKAALCQRDLALYGGLLLGGLLYGLLRRWIRPLPFWAFALCLLPMAIDGGTQLLMLRESNWLLRSLTGGLVGLSTVWVLYPHLETAFADLRRQANERVHVE